MEFLTQLPLLACKDADARRSAMMHALETARLPYTVQRAQPDEKRLRTAENYLVKIGEADAPCVLFCAHYDAYPGSFGANDNAAAVCILLDLAHTLQGQGATAEFAFFDAEEEKRAGSRLYMQQLEKGSVTAVVNLDLCGYGDTIVLFDKGCAAKPAMRPFCSKAIQKAHGAQLVKYLPESDDASFRASRIPTLSVAIVPRWDVQYLNALSTYGGGLIGQPPEFEMMMSQMEVSTTMHGGFRDTPEHVQPKAMQRIYDYLLDAFHTEPTRRWRK